MPLLSFLFPILAHETEKISVGEMVVSVGLLAVTGGLLVAMVLFLFLKPVLRARRRRKEGHPPVSSKTPYLVIAVLVVAGFLVFVWKYAWAAYYDIHFQRYEEKLETSGKHPIQGVEYKWNRWHIYGRCGPDGLTLFVDDVLDTADPKQKITALARKIAPSTTDWQPMTWDEKQKAFVAAFKPEGDRMEFEFRLKSGWDSYQDTIVGHIPHISAKQPPGPRSPDHR